MKIIIRLLIISLSAMLAMVPVYSEDTSDHAIALSVDRLSDYITGDVYGTISVDVSSIADYMDLLHENGIYLKFKDVGISKYEDKGYDWISLEIGDTFSMIYTSENDFSGDTVNLCIPNSYRPQREAFVLMLVSFLCIDVQEADSLFQKIEYNVVDGVFYYDGDGYRVEYSETKWFHAMIIRRQFEESTVLD